MNNTSYHFENSSESSKARGKPISIKDKSKIESFFKILVPVNPGKDATSSAF